MKRILALMIAATVLVFSFSACSSDQKKETESQANQPTAGLERVEETTIGETRTSLHYEIVSTQTYQNDYGNTSLCYLVYVSDNEYSKDVTNYAIRDLYIEILQTQDQADVYDTHMIYLFFNRSDATSYGTPDIILAQVVHDDYAGKFIGMGDGDPSYTITNTGKLI